MARLAEVAASAGVSPAVVSRILNEDPTLRVSSDTRDRVRAAIIELDYVPLHAARSMRKTLPTTLTLAIPDATSAVHTDLLRGVEEAAHRRDLAVVLARSEQILEEPNRLARLLREGRTDGIIMHAPPDLTEMGRAAVRNMPGPVVLINGDETTVDRTLVFDDAAGIVVAVDHLIGLGHRAIGFVGGAPRSASAQRRLLGFRAAIEGAGLDNAADWSTHLGYGADDGRGAIAELLHRGDLPTAIVVANVNAAMGAVAELHARGIGIPKEISVVALHDVWHADVLWPPLATVKMPYLELGRRAVEVLVDVPHGTLHEVVAGTAPVLLARASTAPPAPERTRTP